MNRRDFGKLLLAAAATGIVGFPRGSDATGSQKAVSPSGQDSRTKLESMGKQSLENKALKQAITRINRNTIIIESQKFFNLFPRVCGRTLSAIMLSPAELKTYRNAASAVFGQIDSSGMTAVLPQILASLPRDIRFEDQNFIREETSLILRVSGINMNADIAKLAQEADTKRERVVRASGGSHPQMEPMAGPGSTRGIAGAVAGAIANLRDLIDNGNNTAGDVYMDILSIIFGIAGLFR